jgi:hypothetical protein
MENRPGGVPISHLGELLKKVKIKRGKREEKNQKER